METAATHRQGEILAALRRAGGSARIQALATALAVTDETVRRNIRRLEAEGLVEKLHGGARLTEPVAEGDLQSRVREQPEAKRRIADCVAGLIPDGASLFLDVGSTTAFIADALRDHRTLTVVTNSVTVAAKLATRNGNRVFFAGGELRAHDGGSFGVDALQFIANFQTDFAVMSATAINAEQGFLLFDLEEARFARAIMAQARSTIVAADSRKFGRSAPIVVGDPARVSVLVTDDSPPTAVIEAAKHWGTRIKLAP
ncbi:DeoR/GlpR family DNA-binding transcription regulator [Gemmobacter fulvus]|uniref:DeoR/GlpR family DNA-binding transcription regulator n=1 Tax=Gemmobacter fulvus TaxID=2840474 RepID=UPI0027964733|nr:DeoR/GlpR family DNA-binding transcription regulator [Gemmobacter fulvus]MDQ1848871.1 DeoR/GlpR family DNA-binding transcription regulator [Gemmobacter fulvus]